MNENMQKSPEEQERDQLVNEINSNHRKPLDMMETTIKYCMKYKKDETKQKAEFISLLKSAYPMNFIKKFYADYKNPPRTIEKIPSRDQAVLDKHNKEKEKEEKADKKKKK